MNMEQRLDEVNGQFDNYKCGYCGSIGSQPVTVQSQDADELGVLCECKCTRCGISQFWHSIESDTTEVWSYKRPDERLDDLSRGDEIRLQVPTYDFGLDENGEAVKERDGRRFYVMRVVKVTKGGVFMQDDVNTHPFGMFVATYPDENHSHASLCEMNGTTIEGRQKIERIDYLDDQP